MSEETESYEQLNSSDLEPGRTATDDSHYTHAELVAQIESLNAENARLRGGTPWLQRYLFRRRNFLISVLAFVIFGSTVVLSIIVLLDAAGSIVLPNYRVVLIALAGTGLFASILAYVLTPERFIEADVARQLVDSLTENEGAIVDELGLHGQPHVVPSNDTAEPAHLVVTSSMGSPAMPAVDAHIRVRIDPENIVLQPSGVPLYKSLVSRNGALPNAVDELCRFIADALVEQFGLVDSVDVDTTYGRATLTVSGSVLGPVDRFNHPVASVFATGIAIKTGTPVAVSVTRADAGEDWRVTCYWSVTHD